MKYVDGVMNYTGSKFKLLEQLLPEMNYSKTYFVDLFCGGGAVYVNILDKYEKIIVNDIITDLVGIHQELMFGDEIVELTKGLCPGKNNPDGFSKLRTDYNNNPSPEGLWALILSSTNNMIRFNKNLKYNQTYGNRGWNDNTQKKVDIFKEHIRKFKDNLVYLSSTFEKIDIQSNMMVYCDPPYSNTSAGYNAYWKKDDDQKLYEYLKMIDLKGSSFMVSGVLNDKPCYLLDKLISDGYKVIELNFNYNKVSRKGDKETTEIIIMNYEN